MLVAPVRVSPVSFLARSGAETNVEAVVITLGLRLIPRCPVTVGPGAVWPLLILAYRLLHGRVTASIVSQELISAARAFSRIAIPDLGVLACWMLIGKLLYKNAISVLVAATEYFVEPIIQTTLAVIIVLAPLLGIRGAIGLFFLLALRLLHVPPIVALPALGIIHEVALATARIAPTVPLLVSRTLIAFHGEMAFGVGRSEYDGVS